MKRTGKGILDIIWYIIVFALLQYVCLVLTATVSMAVGGKSASQIAHAVLNGSLGLGSTLIIVATILSSLLTLVLFVWRGWAPISRTYLRSKPWAVFAWVTILAVGTIIPSEFLVEQVDIQLPEPTQQLFEGILSEPLGYVAVGIFAPLVEELVFRGAILRTLLRFFSSRMHWLPIIISALIFGTLHMNWAQFIHAFLIGLLLGWMYYRTNSILPGVLFHWVNNTMAFVLYHLTPSMADGKLIDLFNGSQRTVWLSLFFSFCLIIPAIYQLALRMRRNGSGHEIINN